MPKIHIVLAIIQAGISIQEDPRVNSLYALLAHNRNQLYSICENQDDNGDIMAHDAVLFCLGLGQKPHWMAAAGL